MGIAVPRPAMRGKEERLIRLQLQFHALRTGEYIAGGYEATAASIQARKDAMRLGKEFRRLDRIRQILAKALPAGRQVVG